MKSKRSGGAGRSGGATASVGVLSTYATADNPKAPTDAEETRSIVSGLEGLVTLAARHPDTPEVGWIVRDIKAQHRVCVLYPNNEVLSAILAVSVARLAEAVGRA